MPVPTVFLKLTNDVPVPAVTMDDVPVADHEQKRVTPGEQVRMYNNSLRTSENVALAKLELSYTTPAMDHAEYADLMALLTAGVELTAEGASIDRSGGGVQVLATVTSDKPVPHGSADYQRIVTFTLAQV